MGRVHANDPLASGPGPSSTTEVTRALRDADRLNVQAMLARAAESDGFWPLSDQLAADLAEPSADETRRPIAVRLVDTADRSLIGYAQASRRTGGWTMQIAVEPDRRGTECDGVDVLVEATIGAIDIAGGGNVDWWTYEPSPEIGELADAHGFRFDRDLVQMRRALPAEGHSTVSTRSFVVGQDDEAWIAVNNRAFSGHPEQGGWTIETLRQRIAQPWFDPAGFRLHERSDRLAAFCWTKVHDEMETRHGEIYVIGVDPDFQGLGLGKQLTLAGLDHLSDRGIEHALLYVDGANTAAREMYERLAFQVHRTDRAYTRKIEPALVAPAGTGSSQ